MGTMYGIQIGQHALGNAAGNIVTISGGLQFLLISPVRHKPALDQDSRAGRIAKHHKPRVLNTTVLRMRIAESPAISAMHANLLLDITGKPV